MPTIIDVAQRAGVSIKTVSRVLNQSENVRAATREKVRAAMAELDYRPSTAARELRSGRSRAIGMLFGDPSSGFQSRLHHAALQACNEAGFYLSAGLFDERARDWDAQLAAFLRRTRVERMVLVPPLCDGEALREHLDRNGIHYVLISPSRPSARAATVGMDDRRAAVEMTQHLLGLGHRRIAHLTGPEDHSASLERRAGFLSALADAGAPAPPDAWIRSGRFRFREALDAAEAVLSARDRPTAVFAANDEMAAAVCFTANRLGLRVPEDLSVAGFDDVALARTLWPPLTTVAQPFEAMAVEVVRLLARPEPELGATKRILPHELVVRRSTGPAPRA